MIICEMKDQYMLYAFFFIAKFFKNELDLSLYNFSPKTSRYRQI